jgi:hypothetical protein
MCPSSIQLSELVKILTKDFDEFKEIVYATGEKLRLRDSEEYKHSILFSEGNF